MRTNPPIIVFLRNFLLLSLLIFITPKLSIAKPKLIDVATNATDPNNLSDTEPSIAVNPVNPLEIVIVTFSESWGPGTMAPVWKSNDGGNTWRKVFQIPQPVLNLIGPADQKIAFDAKGKLFVAELGFGFGSPIQDFIYRQTTGPDAPLAVGASYGGDQPHLDVDRAATSPCIGTLYSPWLNIGVIPWQAFVSFSTNAGITMTDVAAGNNTTFPNRTTRVALAPDGSAYIVYKTREGTLGNRFENAHFLVNRSDDCGVTWTGLGAAGVSIHGTPQVQTFFTKRFGNLAKGNKTARARSSDCWIAVDPGDGDIYVAYIDQDASTFGQIFVARSTDRGNTWASNRVTDGKNHSAFPEIAVSDNGTVGVLYVDYDDSGTKTIFRHRFARSFDDGVTWTDDILQSMDPEPLNNAKHEFLWGDYEGLTALGNSFYGVFTGQSIGRSVNQLDPIFFKETALPFTLSLCDCPPVKSSPPVLGTGYIKLICVFRGCTIIDPLPKNCLYKFDCPGCDKIGLCPPYYHIYMDSLNDIWNVGLFDKNGNPAPYQEFDNNLGKIISFRPSKEFYIDGQIGEYFLAFKMKSKGKPGVEYTIPMRVEHSDRPYKR